jgi:hypothetical protein
MSEPLISNYPQTSWCHPEEPFVGRAAWDSAMLPPEMAVFFALAPVLPWSYRAADTGGSVLSVV